MKTVACKFCWQELTGEPHYHFGREYVYELEGRNMKTIVAVYERDRHYGGPEEGGWWYDSGKLVYTELCYTVEWARVRADRLAEGEYRRTDDRGRVNYRHGDYGIEIWQVERDGMPPEFYPETRPYYE